MKRKLLMIGLLVSAMAISRWTIAEDAAAQPRLTGIVCWENHWEALLELPVKGTLAKPILAAGEAVSGYKVTSIDEEKGTVELTLPGNEKKVLLDLGLPPAEQVPRRSLHFRSTDLSQVLDVYQWFAGRTIIRSTRFPKQRLDFKSGPGLSTKDAAAALERALAEIGITMKPIDTKFTFALCEGDEQRVSNLRKPPWEDPANDEIFPPGLIKFVAADCSQVLDVYSELTGLIVIGAQRVCRDGITYRSQTARSQAAWLLEAALLLADARMVPEADTFIFVVPANRPFELPHFDAKQNANGETIRLRPMDGEKLLATYARLVGREPIPEGQVPRRDTFFVGGPKPLTSAEALFALRAVAKLNGFEFVPVGEKYVKLDRLPR
jgi:hypothetical protein